MKNYQTEDPCLVCRTESVDRTFHHIKTRGSGGGDQEWNLMPLCFECHYTVHNIGLNSFSIRYPQVASFLVGHGWEKIGNKWMHNE